MSRQIVLDTETTGLNVAEGHRVIEIGAVEILDRRITGEHFHEYFNPGRSIEAGALEVHGISEEFLADKPRFEDVVAEFVRFVDGAELVIHNAPFDVGFLDHELARLPAPRRIADMCRVLDTLTMARELHPGQRNSLDALCTRYDVNNSSRQLHGALLDAEILADVYLAMTGGQATLDLSAVQTSAAHATTRRPGERRARGPLRVLHAGADELAAHERRLESLDAASGGPCMWRAVDV